MKKLLVAFEVSGPLGGSVELVLTILDKNASPNVLQAFTLAVYVTAIYEE